MTTLSGASPLLSIGGNRQVLELRVEDSGSAVSVHALRHISPRSPLGSEFARSAGGGCGTHPSSGGEATERLLSMLLPVLGRGFLSSSAARWDIMRRTGPSTARRPLRFRMRVSWVPRSLLCIVQGFEDPKA
ncbi:hypothetical protein SCP_0104730 [Sparassis crispa]|uniref:Uncharacterized protein n=1 Tax=Sparassis crispa TaxID=139825 RepID=A0A401G601_9APHY|nr:hypothetical protein SCP_0104730 [Sparassis crispa]GBE77593.1 hypothetical protein SCP_0104730 [Sparassis crispa]